MLWTRRCNKCNVEGMHTPLKENNRKICFNFLRSKYAANKMHHAFNYGFIKKGDYIRGLPVSFTKEKYWPFWDTNAKIWCNFWNIICIIRLFNEIETSVIHVYLHCRAILKICWWAWIRHILNPNTDCISIFLSWHDGVSNYMKGWFTTLQITT